MKAGVKKELSITRQSVLFDCGQVGPSARLQSEHVLMAEGAAGDDRVGSARRGLLVPALLGTQLSEPSLMTAGAGQG